MLFTELESERLIFRKYTLEDTPQIFFLRTDELVNKFIKREGPTKIKEVKDFIIKTNASIDNNTLYNWAICLKGETKLIGTICLWNLSKDRKTAEIGYALHPSYQKKGIMDEALKTIIKHGFTELGFQTIEAFTSKKNAASTKLLLRNNFILESTRRDKDDKNNRIYILKNRY